MYALTTIALYPLYVEARKILVERREAYERECEEYARDGYRPQHCIHGTYLWTDYDPICGGCESGEESESDAKRAHQMARNEAHRLGLKMRPYTEWEHFCRPDDRWADYELHPEKYEL